MKERDRVIWYLKEESKSYKKLSGLLIDENSQLKKRSKDMWVLDLVKRLEKLEEENKKLTEENRKLKEELDKAHTAYRAVRRVNRELMNWYV